MSTWISKEASELRKAGIHYVTHDLGQLCLTCATDYPLSGEVSFHESGFCYNCGPDDLESRRQAPAAPRRRPRRPRDPMRPCAAGFTPIDDTGVRCDYCGRWVRRTGISGHKQKCGGWKEQYR